MKSFFIGNLEFKLPIIQGGMGVGVSLSGLASAVANEGGIGVISCAGLGLIYHKSHGNYLTKCISGLKKEISKAKEKSKGIIGVNIMVALTNYTDMVKTSIAEKGLEKPKTDPFHCIKTYDYTKSYCIVQCLYQAAKGYMKKGYAFTGINVHLSSKISTVKEVISGLKREFSSVELERGL